VHAVVVPVVTTQEQVVFPVPPELLPEPLPLPLPPPELPPLIPHCEAQFCSSQDTMDCSALAQDESICC